jgi:peroxiredoxin
MPKQPNIASATLALCVLLALSGCDQSTEESLYYEEDAAYREQVGEPVAAFKFTSLAGEKVDLARYRGSVVLLDFWATWTSPCMELIPVKKAAFKRYHHAGLEIVSISADFDKKELQSVIAREGIEWPQYYNPSGKDNAAVKQFGIKHFPSMWILDRKGNIRYISAAQDLNMKIESLLKETAAPAGKPGWTDRVTSIFKSEKVEDPVQAMDELIASPDVYIDIKNVTITRTRQIATVKTSGGTHQVVTGKKVEVPTDAGSITVICKEIRADAVAFVIPGQDELITVKF